MIEDLKPYPEYKDSGLPWLGKVPPHWVIKRGKSYLNCIDERSKTGKEELLTVSSARGVIPRHSATVTMFKAKSYVGYKLCWPGDLVINCLWAWGGGLGVTQHHGIISTAYSVYRSRPSANILPRFLHELVRSSSFNWELHVRSKGIWISRLQLTDTAFLDAPLPLPPPDEQAAIVRFLDHANGKIERAIRAKRKLIALLNEQKQAIIHRAVTRGLDPNVKLKPSGIPWLGDVPKHWMVMPLRKLVTPGRHITYGIVQPGEPKKSGRFMIRGKDYSFGWAKPETIFRVSNEIENPYSRSRLKPGDIVMTIVGAGVGNVAVVPDWLDGANITQTTARIALNSAVANPSFVELVLQGPVGRRNLERYVYGSAQPRMNLPHVGAFEIPVPPLAEQIEIANSLQHEMQLTRTSIARTEREVALIREYRTTLTAEVVTGKLDVREAVKRLPAEAEEQSLNEPLNELDDDLEATDEDMAE